MYIYIYVLFVFICICFIFRIMDIIFKIYIVRKKEFCKKVFVWDVDINLFKL